MGRDCGEGRRAGLSFGQAGGRHDPRRNPRAAAGPSRPEEGKSYGYPSFKAGGKFLTRIRDEDDSLVVYVASTDERDMLIEAESRTFHLTDHYRSYPIVLARIETVDPAWLRSHMIRRWRRVASKKAVKAWDAENPRA